MFKNESTIIDQVSDFKHLLAFLGDSKVIIIDTGGRMSVEKSRKTQDSGFKETKLFRRRSIDHCDLTGAYSGRSIFRSVISIRIKVFGNG